MAEDRLSAEEQLGILQNQVDSAHANAVRKAGNQKRRMDRIEANHRELREMFGRLMGIVETLVADIEALGGLE